MTEKKLLQIAKRFSEESKATYKGTRGAPQAEYETAVYDPVRARDLFRAKQKTDIQLSCLSASELNELRTIVAIGKHLYDLSDDPKDPKNRKTIPKDDHAVWRRVLNVRTLSPDQSIEDLRMHSASYIVNAIKEYILSGSMSSFKRNAMLIRMMKRGII